MTKEKIAAETVESLQEILTNLAHIKGKDYAQLVLDWVKIQISCDMLASAPVEPMLLPKLGFLANQARELSFRYVTLTLALVLEVDQAEGPVWDKALDQFAEDCKLLVGPLTQGMAKVKQL